MKRLEPDQSSEQWLFSEPLQDVGTERLTAAVKLHRPDLKLPQPSHVREILAIGDWLNLLPEEVVQQLIREKVLSSSYVHQRRWLSTVIGPTHPLRSQRGIGFTQLRALCCLGNHDDPSTIESLVAQIQNGSLSVRAILARLERSCSGCSRKLPLNGGELAEGVIAIVPGRYRNTSTSNPNEVAGSRDSGRQTSTSRDVQRKFFCGPECARDYLDRLINRRG